MQPPPPAPAYPSGAHLPCQAHSTAAPEIPIDDPTNLARPFGGEDGIPMDIYFDVERDRLVRG